MDKDTLNRLLDSIYELEGLVHLALNRDDNPDHLPELIKRKGEQLARYAGQLTESTPLEAVETPSLDGLLIDSEDVGDMTGIPYESIEKPIVEESPIEEAMVSAVETVFNNLPDSDLPDSDFSTDDIAEEEEELENNPKEPRGKLVFSINDRYLFKRELFANSDADFNNTLSLVASMENYDEAEDYFLGELQWDQKKPEVTDFLEIIKKYFKE